MAYKLILNTKFNQHSIPPTSKDSESMTVWKRSLLIMFSYMQNIWGLFKWHSTPHKSIWSILQRIVQIQCNYQSITWLKLSCTVLELPHKQRLILIWINHLCWKQKKQTNKLKTPCVCKNAIIISSNWKSVSLLFFPIWREKKRHFLKVVQDEKE